MLAFRRATPALVEGATQFFHLPEPILAFTRGKELLCLFNLSPESHTLTVAGLGEPIGPSMGATRMGNRLTLGPNAAVFLPVEEKFSLSE